MSYELRPRREGDGFWMMGTAGENLGARNLIYLNVSSEWMLADADAVAEMPVIGITKHAITSGRKGQIFFYGFIGNEDWAWTAGAPIYASATPGALSQSAPSHLRQTMGYAYTSNMIYFEPKPIENLIYWTDDIRMKTCSTYDRWQIQQNCGNAWWVVDAWRSERIMDNFSSIFDITGGLFQTIIGEIPWYAVKAGVGTFTANVGPNTGMCVTTGAVINNSNLFASGDNTGPVLVWNPANQIWGH